jgi:hypothetical protein
MNKLVAPATSKRHEFLQQDRDDKITLLSKKLAWAYITVLISKLQCIFSNK